MLGGRELFARCVAAYSSLGPNSVLARVLFVSVSDNQEAILQKRRHSSEFEGNPTNE